MQRARLLGPECIRVKLGPSAQRRIIDALAGNELRRRSEAILVQELREPTLELLA